MLEMLTGVSKMYRPPRQEVLKGRAYVHESDTVPQAVLAMQAEAETKKRSMRELFFTNRETRTGYNDTHWDGYVGTTNVMRPVYNLQTIRENDESNTTEMTRLQNVDMSQAVPMYSAPSHMKPAVSILAQDKARGAPRVQFQYDVDNINSHRIGVVHDGGHGNVETVNSRSNFAVDLPSWSADGHPIQDRVVDRTMYAGMGMKLDASQYASATAPTALHSERGAQRDSQFARFNGPQPQQQLDMASLMAVVTDSKHARDSQYIARQQGLYLHGGYGGVPMPMFAGDSGRDQHIAGWTQPMQMQVAAPGRPSAFTDGRGTDSLMAPRAAAFQAGGDGGSAAPWVGSERYVHDSALGGATRTFQYQPDGTRTHAGPVMNTGRWAGDGQLGDGARAFQYQSDGGGQGGFPTNSGRHVGDAQVGDIARAFQYQSDAGGHAGVPINSGRYASDAQVGDSARKFQYETNGGTVGPAVAAGGYVGDALLGDSARKFQYETNRGTVGPVVAAGGYVGDAHLGDSARKFQYETNGRTVGPVVAAGGYVGDALLGDGARKFQYQPDASSGAGVAASTAYANDAHLGDVARKFQYQPDVGGGGAAAVASARYAGDARVGDTARAFQYQSGGGGVAAAAVGSGHWMGDAQTGVLKQQWGLPTPVQHAAAPTTPNERWGGRDAQVGTVSHQQLQVSSVTQTSTPQTVMRHGYDAQLASLGPSMTVTGGDGGGGTQQHSERYARDSHVSTAPQQFTTAEFGQHAATGPRGADTHGRDSQVGLGAVARVHTVSEPGRGTPSANARDSGRDSMMGAANTSMAGLEGRVALHRAAPVSDRPAVEKTSRPGFMSTNKTLFWTGQAIADTQMHAYTPPPLKKTDTVNVYAERDRIYRNKQAKSATETRPAYKSTGGRRMDENPANQLSRSAFNMPSRGLMEALLENQLYNKVVDESMSAIHPGYESDA
jgi:hypothetical protein